MELEKRAFLKASLSILLIGSREITVLNLVFGLLPYPSILALNFSEWNGI